MTGRVIFVISIVMESNAKRLRRAIKITAIVALAIAMPFAAMIYLRATRGDSLHDFGEVKPFIVRDRGGQYLDHTQLANHVTVVAFFSNSCKAASTAGQPSHACANMIATSDKVAKWLIEQLASEPDKPKAPVRQFAVAPAGFDAGKDWRTFDLGEFTQGQIIPDDPATAPSAFYAIDPTRHFRGIFRVDSDGGMDAPTWDNFRQSLSRMTMNLYFNDYLSKRTFFGPVKAKPTPSPP